MALSFDGVDDQVSHGDVAGAEGQFLTIAFWAYFNTLTNNDLIVDKLVAASSGFRLWVFTGPVLRALIGAATSGDMRTAGGVLTTGTWAHWAMVFDGTQATSALRLKLFKDGEPLALTVASAVPSTIIANAVAVTAGGAAGPLDGLMAGLKLWNVALTDAEIMQQALMDRPIRTDGLLIRAPYDDATAARDYSGSGNHGTVTGALAAAGPPLGYGASALVA